MSVYDAVAPTFDRHRAIPDAAVEAIRSAMFSAIRGTSRPRFLDIGAGTGRVGLPFVAAGDDYVGVDLSLGMLRQFAKRSHTRGWHSPHLVQADGKHLPFRDATFDAIILVQIFGGLRGWQKLFAEARRVLRPIGFVFVGRSVSPDTGVDTRMKQRLALILDELGVRSDNINTGEHVLRWLETTAERSDCVMPVAWDVERTPRAFLDRHQTGASFSALPSWIKEDAMRKLSVWAEATFGSLDRIVAERHSFKLRVFQFSTGGAFRNE